MLIGFGELGDCIQYYSIVVVLDVLPAEASPIALRLVLCSPLSVSYLLNDSPLLLFLSPLRSTAYIDHRFLSFALHNVQDFL